MNSKLPPGKAAIVKWMKAVARDIPTAALQDSIIDIRAGEYILGIDIYLDGISSAGWTDDEIEHFATELGNACFLVEEDPHPEYMDEDKVNELVEKFMRNAGYTRELDLSE